MLKAQAIRGNRDPDANKRVMRILRQRIARHDLLPGTPLREQELSQEFGVSRSRIREVFALLEQLGLIERMPNKGALVRRQSLSHLLELLSVREVLDGLCTRLATDNAEPESWQDLVNLFGKPAEKMIRSGDVRGFLASHALLRKRVLKAAANATLLDNLIPIYDQTDMALRRLILLTPRANEALVEHQLVIAAMRRGDGENAEQLKRKQIRNVRDSLERYHQLLL